MGLFHRNKKHPDRTVLVTVTITGKLVPAAYALLLSAVSTTTLALALTENQPPPEAVDAYHPTLPHQLPEPQNPICVAHLS